MSKKMDGFGDRLRQAAEHARVPYSPTKLGEKLGNIGKQRVQNWMRGTLPRADVLFDVSDHLDVDARWLATGKGQMVRSASDSGLSDVEQKLIEHWRAADPQWQQAVRLMAALSVTGHKDIAALLDRAPDTRMRRPIFLNNQTRKK